MYDNLVKYCLYNGGEIYPLDIKAEDGKGLCVCNPSIYIDNDNTIRLILRNVNYALWNSDDGNKFSSPYGPISYITKDDDQRLRTENYLCEYSNNVLRYKYIDMVFDKEPLWEFVGLEDARLVRWDNKLYITGVRRDTTENGQGRMELSEITEDGIELSRVRIKAPGDDSSYCEKNWMPILDMPYCYVKWCNPLEIVEVNPETGDSKTIIEKDYSDIDIQNMYFDSMSIRGSSQVINCGEYRIAIVHMCKLWLNDKNQKSGSGYYHKFMIWDKNWNIVRISEPFNFAGFGIEFTNGLAIKDDFMLIPFALQDNFSFMIKIKTDIVLDWIFGNIKEIGELNTNNVYAKFFNNTKDSYSCIELTQEYYSHGNYAASMVLSERACEYNTFRLSDDLYESLYICGQSLANLGNRDIYEKSIWLRMIDLFPERSEGHYMLAKYYFYRSMFQESYTFARMAYTKNYLKFDSSLISTIDCEILYAKAMYFTEWYTDSESILRNILFNKETNESQRYEILNMLDYIESNKKNKVRVL